MRNELFVTCLTLGVAVTFLLWLANSAIMWLIFSAVVIAIITFLLWLIWDDPTYFNHDIENDFEESSEQFNQPPGDSENPFPGIIRDSSDKEFYEDEIDK